MPKCSKSQKRKKTFNQLPYRDACVQPCKQKFHQPFDQRWCTVIIIYSHLSDSFTICITQKRFIFVVDQSRSKLSLLKVRPTDHPPSWVSSSPSLTINVDLGSLLNPTPVWSFKAKMRLKIMQKSQEIVR